MTLVKRRPWWKFWPVVCWRHLRIVRRNECCQSCVRADVRRRHPDWFRSSK